MKQINKELVTEHHMYSNINYNFSESHPENLLSASLKSHLRS